jgi:predicted metal-dependent hydrolase
LPKEPALKPTTARDVNLSFGPSLPRQWAYGDVYLTAFSDALSLIIPAGERFFIRSVKRHEKWVTDPVQAEAVRAFIGQEAAHSRVHSAHAEYLASFGPGIRDLNSRYERGFRRLEKLCPAIVCLAITAAMEHFTAVIAAAILKIRFHDGAPSPMRDLWYWHAAEEIEHKAVAYDVLQLAAPRNYPLRVLGFVMAIGIQGRQLKHAIRRLFADQGYDAAGRKKARRDFLEKGILPTGGQGKLLRHFFAYLRPGFHPDQVDDRHLAENYFRTANLNASVIEPPSGVSARSSA